MEAFRKVQRKYSPHNFGQEDSKDGIS